MIRFEQSHVLASQSKTQEFSDSTVFLLSYAEALGREDFLEVEDAENCECSHGRLGEFFKIKYLIGMLSAARPFYKQAGASVSSVFEIGPVFRAEPHFTTRHVNEYISLDGEMAFIESVGDVMNELEYSRSIEKSVKREEECNCAERVFIPRMKLTERCRFSKWQENGEWEIDIDGRRTDDLRACKERDGFDFVFLTHYPTAIRPFYTMPSKDPQFTES